MGSSAKADLVRCHSLSDRRVHVVGCLVSFPVHLAASCYRAFFTSSPRLSVSRRREKRVHSFHFAHAKRLCNSRASQRDKFARVFVLSGVHTAYRVKRFVLTSFKGVLWSSCE